MSPSDKPLREPSETPTQRTQTVRRVVDLHGKGLAVWQIAERRGVTVARVVSILTAAGLRPRKPITPP